MTSRVERRNAELARAEALRAEQKYDQLVAWLSQRPRDELLEEPQLAYLLAISLYYTGKESASAGLLAQLRLQSTLRPRSRLWFRMENLEAILKLEAGDLYGAEAGFRRLEHEASAVGDRLTQGSVIHNRSIISAIRCEFDEALVALGRAQVIYEQLGIKTEAIRVRHNIGMVYREVGFYSAANSNFELAIDGARRAEFYHEVAFIDLERALLFLRSGDARLAQRTAERGMQIARSLQYTRIEGEGFRVLGTIANACREWDRARELLNAGLIIARETDTKLLEAEILEQLTIYYLGLDDLPNAVSAAKASAAVFSAMGASIPSRRVLGLVGGSAED